ncbi:glycosyltransferase family 4 protein [Candidatus Latescibacterota bacterium]
MKILYIHQHFSTRSGSWGTRSYEMARKLVARGHQVTMLCGNSTLGHTGVKGRQPVNRGNVEGIDVILLHLPYSNYDNFVKRSMTFLRFSFRSAKIVLTEDYDMVFATTTPLTTAIPGIIAKYFRRKPFVFEVRDLWPELPKAMGVIKNPVILGGMAVLEYLSYRAADRLIGLAPGIVEGIKRIKGKNADVAMISNCCDTDLFMPGIGDRSLIPGVSKDDLLAIFTGAHGMANGLDAVLDVAVELKQRGIGDIKFLFIGDGKLKPALMARKEQEGLDNCIFMDPVMKTELAMILATADVGLMILANVSAFYYGTSPNKFFDYIASGLPVINNYPGWLADMINTYQFGIVVPPGYPNKFADALEYMADNRIQLREMSRKARKLAESKFNRDELSNRFAEFLEKM